MKIHEYQAKQLLREAGVTVPRGLVFVEFMIDLLLPIAVRPAAVAGFACVRNLRGMTG